MAVLMSDIALDAFSDANDWLCPLFKSNRDNCTIDCDVLPTLPETFFTLSTICLNREFNKTRLVENSSKTGSLDRCFNMRRFPSVIVSTSCFKSCRLCEDPAPEKNPTSIRITARTINNTARQDEDGIR